VDAGAVETLQLAPGATLAQLANRAHQAHPATDLVLVFADTTLPSGWLERLCAAADSDSTAATASALSTATLVAFERERRQTGQSTDAAEPAGARIAWSAERAAAVAGSSARIRPRLAGILPTCVYLRSAALDLVGPLDETFSSSYAAVLDLSLRARRRGLVNVLADDVLCDAPAVELDVEEHNTLQARHANLLAAAEQPHAPALERSLTLASVAGERLAVTVDARGLGPHVGGTREYLLGLLKALTEEGSVRLRILIAPDLGEATRAELLSLEAVELLTYEQALEKPDPSHVVHRPQQVFSPEDLMLLRPLGDRVVITHQDLIAYRNPEYFASIELWSRYARTTRQALAVADHVLFFSRDAREDALREDLIDPSRASVARLGADGPVVTGSMTPSAIKLPPSIARLASGPFLLCIGADYQHKNRPFAIAVLDELRRSHRWLGKLVLVGQHVDSGSSREQEREAMAQRSLTDDLVVDLGPVSSETRSWLMAHCSAVIYPTVHEGFGLVPFEAAVANVPCLFAAQSSLAELLDPELATLVPWDAARSAKGAFALLVDDIARETHLRRLTETASALRWSDCAHGTISGYESAIAAPYRASSLDAWRALERENEIVRLDESRKQLSARVRELSDDLGEDAQALVGARALLSRSDQRALLAVAARPAFRRLLFGTLRSGFGAAHAIRRLRE
jgi:hypothetical protein